MTAARLECAGDGLLADPSGALIWPDRDLLVVADLHLEKGSSLARQGALLPPYDTRTTLTRLEAALGQWRPRRVISLGDGFHDPAASTRLDADDRARLARLVRAHDWLWIAGNHDPEPPAELGGRVELVVEIGGIVFRHLPAATGGAVDGPANGGLPTGDDAAGKVTPAGGASSVTMADPPAHDAMGDAAVEVAGHLHPKATVAVRGRRLARRCFVSDRRRVLLPAFGSYTGGLDVFDPAIAGLFAAGFRVALLNAGRVHPLPHQRLARPGEP